MDATQTGDSHQYASVQSVNVDGSYQVRINGATSDVRAARLCDAEVGDRVFCVVYSGQVAAIGRVGAFGSPTKVSAIASIISQDATQAANYPVTAANAYRWGHIVHISIFFKPAAAVTTGTNMSIGTLTSAYTPITNAVFGSGYLTGGITSTGEVSARARTALTANTTYASASIFLVA